MNLNPRIILKPAFTVVGLTCLEPELNGSTEALWAQLGERYQEIPQADPDAGFGVHTWGQTGRQYLAGLALRGGAGSSQCPHGMTTLQIEAHAYAVFTHTGLMRDLPDRVNHIYGEWLPGSGYRGAGDFYFEYYDDRFLPGSCDSVVFVYVPVLSPSPRKKKEPSPLKRERAG